MVIIDGGYRETILDLYYYIDLSEQEPVVLREGKGSLDILARYR
jgi:hypothetical protein